ncbi:MAG: efflux RND transporter periplasmic adaptor subunit, partial [Verrucomicrobiales bacterium]
VEAARASELGFELAGTIVHLSVDDGERIEAGQVIAELDTARLSARRSEVAAGVEDAEATLQLATLTSERTALAQASNAVSVQQLDEAKQSKVSATAALQRMRARLDAIDVDLAKSKLVAPYAGTISARRVDEGTIVDAGQPIFRLLETSKLEIRAGLSPLAVRAFTEGQTVAVWTASGQELQASVTRLLPQRDPRTRTIDVILRPADPGHDLRDGDLVDVPVTRQIVGEGMWLPRTALTESVRGLWAAYVLVPSEETFPDQRRLERRQLEILEEEGDRVFVRGAIGNGDRVAVKGLHRLAPGQLVRVVDSSAGSELSKR